MFKKLRNKLLLVNILIIAALLLGSFSVIYITTARNTMRDIDMKLERSINFAREGGGEGRNRPFSEEQPPDGTKPPDDGQMKMNNFRGEHGEPPEAMRDDIFSITFTVVTNKDGDIQNVNMPFDLGEDFYSERNDILTNVKEGRLKSDSGYWAYRTVESDTGYITAFTQVNSEQSFMRNLLIALLSVAIMAIIIAFLISLFSANRSIRPVEESYNKQKQFVADASHELKTPLATISTNVDVLLSHEDSTIREEKKWLGYIKTETERMTKLTNDLLYLARLDHNENDVLTTNVSFSEASEEVILLMEAVIFEKDIVMDYDIESNLCVNASAEQLKQIVMILVDNAVKYTPPKGEIKVRLRKEASDAVLTVENTGEGISAEALSHIFERFYREDKSRARKSGGYGLGLAIAHAIVTSYKGTIRAESEKNKYARFTVRLPLVK